MGVRDEVPVSDSKTKIVPYLVFCHKHTPTGEIKKYKHHYCVHRDLQEGEHDLSSLGAPFGSCWLLPSPKEGKSSAQTLTMHLFWQSLWNPSGYTFLLGIDPSSQVSHVTSNILFTAPSLFLGSSS